MEPIEMRPPGHGNNCHGHYTAIAVGGKGHWPGDSCGCFDGGDAPTAPIDFILLPLLITAVFLIKKFQNETKEQI